MNSDRKMSENFHIDYSKIIFGPLKESKDIIIILVPLYYKDNKIRVLLFKCRVTNLKNLQFRRLCLLKDII